MTLKSSINRRTFIKASALSALGSAILPMPSFAANWPDRPIRMVVAFPAGGPTDTIARVIAERLSERLGQHIVVDNRAGASGSVGTSQFIRSKPDGYTISMFGMPALIAPIVHRNGLYDVRTDFTCVSTVYDLPYVVIINTDVLPGVENFQQLIEASKTNEINFSSPGVGSIGHMAMEQLKGLGKFEMQHIAYSGSAPAIVDLIGGQTGMMVSDMIAAMPHIQSGSVKPIAVLSDSGTTFLPEVKSVAEQGFPGYQASSWSGLIVPNDTPQEVSDRLNKELKELLTDTELQERMIKLGAIATYQTAEEMTTRLNNEYDRWNQVAKDIDIWNL
ncbi:tripartite tricarboxylate transporter substrate binding protein [Pusillimonas sp. MFBS29]|uniref:Bug family tripartite tricarboxylate transporter substrate binding protein n=1 Tax=Pusillimonas sp. MFBS29 TaxID=2886690 RepID=UPI001D12B744|nr:tripartite tricarboxylate transporter substrate binding protein [Pusillimonas sp. MFBS29]MCC2596975.1 tripartite tricarboxylate transporter substrate binding protein [Pusillimonas sp. MFBS29]